MALAWSYDLLFPDDQRGLWALAVFDGGARLAAVEDVLTALGVPTESALDVFARLAHRSLVTVDIGPDGAVRYRLLDSVRAFGRELLLASGTADAAYGAHAARFAAAADRCARGVRGSGQAGHLALTRLERANIDAALAWTQMRDPVLGRRIATSGPSTTPRACSASSRRPNSGTPTRPSTCDGRPTPRTVWVSPRPRRTTSPTWAWPRNRTATSRPPSPPTTGPSRRRRPPATCAPPPWRTPGSAALCSPPTRPARGSRLNGRTTRYSSAGGGDALPLAGDVLATLLANAAQ